VGRFRDGRGVVRRVIGVLSPVARVIDNRREALGPSGKENWSRVGEF
jgi:hypothetical protein